MATTFAEQYCARRALAADDYEDEVLKRALYPAARVLRPLLELDPDYFAPDRDFIRGVARLRHLSDFVIEALDYQHHPANRGFLRDRLRLRISVGRMHTLVRRTLRT